VKSIDFAVTLGSSGSDAVRAYKGEARCHRPGPADGRQTLSALRKVDSEVRCCFLTGHTASYSEAD